MDAFLQPVTIHESHEIVGPQRCDLPDSTLFVPSLHTLVIGAFTMTTWCTDDVWWCVSFEFTFIDNQNLVKQWGKVRNLR